MVIASSISGLPIYAPSAGFAPTNSADVSAIASAYQVVSSTATQLYAGTAYVTSVNGAPLSAARAGNAVNATQATSAWYDGTGRLISALPDSAAVSAIASAYAESAASSKQDTLTFGYDTADKISGINGSALAGEGGLVTAIGTSESGITSINNSGLVDTAALHSADYSSLYVQEPLYISASGDSSYIGISGNVGGVDSATCSAIASSYAESAVSSKADSSALSSYVPYSSLEYNTASAISGINGSALAAGSTYSAGEGIDITDDVISVETPVDIVAGPGIVIDNPDGNTLRVSMAADYEVELFTKTLNDNLWTSESLSESIANFERIRITWARRNSICPIVCTEHYVSDINNVEQIMGLDADISGAIYRYMTKYKINGSTYSESAARYYAYGSTINGWQTNNGWCHPIRIVGIHRIANN